MLNTADINKNNSIVLSKLGIVSPILLGKGGEGWVYEFKDKALKIYSNNSTIQYLYSIQNFHSILAKNTFSFETPQIYDVGEVGGIPYTIEKKLTGITMDKKIIGLPTSDRHKLYKSYYEAIKQIGEIAFPDLPYGQIIKTDKSTTATSWSEYLIKMMRQKTEKTRGKMSKLVSNFDAKANICNSLILKHINYDQKNLVHCDYFLNNVLVNDNLQISAILDFSIHSAIGDPKLDIASVLTWNEIDSNVKLEDYSFLYTDAINDYGHDMKVAADIYLLYSSFYFADMEDPSFSVKHLNDEKFWSSLPSSL